MIVCFPFAERVVSANAALGYPFHNDCEGARWEAVTILDALRYPICKKVHPVMCPSMMETWFFSTTLMAGVPQLSLLLSLGNPGYV